MHQYRYIGADDFLTGETALGKIIDDKFQVQVDRFEHPWSHFWHETPEAEWEQLPDVDWDDLGEDDLGDID